MSQRLSLFSVSGASTSVKHKRRYCRVEGCTRIVKSQGKCQRHGAKTRLCKVDGCTKQAQGNFDKMCKSHFKKTQTCLIAEPIDPATIPQHPEGSSVYDEIIPLSLTWTPTNDELMPLVSHLKQGFDESRPRGWHRNAERRARGLLPVHSPSLQLEGWERELVWMEICLLSGNYQSSFRHLARAWGRDKGFHMVLAQFICERRGNVERKKRSKGSNTNGVGPQSDENLELSQLMALDRYDLDMLVSLDGGIAHGTVSAAATATAAAMVELSTSTDQQVVPPSPPSEVTYCQPVISADGGTPAAVYITPPTQEKLISHEDLVCEENLGGDQGGGLPAPPVHAV